MEALPENEAKPAHERGRLADLDISGSGYLSLQQASLGFPGYPAAPPPRAVADILRIRPMLFPSLLAEFVKFRH